MDSGPLQALQLWDQPQPASAATGPAAANGAGPGLHVIASAFSPLGPVAPAGGRAASAARLLGRPEETCPAEGGGPGMRDVRGWRPETAGLRAGAGGGEEWQP